MKETRSKNAKRNIASGVLSSLLIFVINFAMRTAIIYVFNEKYLGLTSVYASIVSVLNIAELGFSSAIIVSMYKPLAEDNNYMVCSLLSYYRKIYRIIGLTIILVGGIVFPFLPILVEDTQLDGGNAYLLYLIYLCDVAMSYFLFSYKTALITAMQRFDITKKVFILSNIIKTTIQILAIFVLKNFYVYAFALVFATVSNNLTINQISKTKYPQYRCKGELSKSQIQDICKQVRGLAIGKVSMIARNSFDSVIISAYLGLTKVAIYNNYYTLYYSITNTLWTITAAIQASVANSIFTEDIDKNYCDLRKFEFIFGWVISWCTCCFVCLYQPFMKLWVGERLMLSTLDMILFSVYFYAISINGVRNLYYDGNGLWWKGRIISILEAVSNLVLNIFLGKFIGVTGILFATIVTIILFNYVGFTNIVFKEYFRRSPKEFYCNRLLYTGVTFIICFFSFYMTSIIDGNSIGAFILKFFACSFCANAGMFILYKKNKQFKVSLFFVRKLILSK